MSGSRHIALYSHLLECQHCLISDMRFCAAAEQMGRDYREHVGSLPAGDKRDEMHESFVNAVVRGRIKRWWERKYQEWRAA